MGHQSRFNLGPAPARPRGTLTTGHLLSVAMIAPFTFYAIGTKSLMVALRGCRAKHRHPRLVGSVVAISRMGARLRILHRPHCLIRGGVLVGIPRGAANVQIGV